MAKQRRNWRYPEEERMIGGVGRGRISELVARQMAVDLPPHLISVDRPISQYGDYRVPLAMEDGSGNQVELTVNVIKTHSMQR